MQRSGYGYGKDSKFYRNPFQSYKRPTYQQSQTNRFGPPSFGGPTIHSSYGYGAQPQWPSAFPAAENNWMPALPINPYQVQSHQNMNWQTQQQLPWGVIQQQQHQVIQHDSWAPAMATNLATNQNNNNNLNSSNHKP